MSKSRIEELICDKGFSYLQPYFYNNPYALRCELGIGEDEYIKNAKKRAREIFAVLFPNGADAIIFDYYIYDYSDSGCAEKNDLAEINVDIERAVSFRLEQAREELRFLLENQIRYRHIAVRNLDIDSCINDDCPDKLRRNRIVCYRDDGDFAYGDLIDAEIGGKGHNVGFVSFENECIMSIYDDRGCDIVFATPEKLREFYHKLHPYFLSFDEEEMKKRFNG